MKLARVHTFSIDAIEVVPVTVEVHVRRGLPDFKVIGLADASVREARERVKSAIQLSGLEFPTALITANLAPASTPKAGAGFDLALALGVLAAAGAVPSELLDRCAVLGELSLDGVVQPCRGTLAVAQACVASGLDGLVVARSRAGEAALASGLEVLAVQTLRSAVRVLSGGECDSLDVDRRDTGIAEMLDLGDVRGQGEAVEALTVAAAGGHNLLLSGPPGTGKTMLAERLPSILPPLSSAEALEVTRIHSIAGEAGSEQLAHRRPFRAPHHTTTAAGLIGSASRKRLGEVTLAHRGVLFLDELPEFPRAVLDTLRQPLESGNVTIVRAQHRAVVPARFQLIAAMNPCPCGYGGDPGGCRCTPSALARYRARISGPLLDRIDLQASVHRPPFDAAPAPSSATVAGAVLEARERQAARLGADGPACNAGMDPAALREHLSLDDPARSVLRTAYERGLISARGQDRVLRVARTVADLAGDDDVRSEHVLRALSLRLDGAAQPMAA